MSNGSRSHTVVTQVEIRSDSTIQVSMEVDAFMPGESVEISGYVVQTNPGAFATINEYQKINARLGETASLTVMATLAPGSDPFQQGHDVTVFLRAAKVWVTVLADGQSQQSGISPQLAEPGTVWGNTQSAVSPGPDFDDDENNGEYNTTTS